MELIPNTNKISFSLLRNESHNVYYNISLLSTQYSISFLLHTRAEVREGHIQKRCFGVPMKNDTYCPLWKINSLSFTQLVEGIIYNNNKRDVCIEMNLLLYRINLKLELLVLHTFILIGLYSGQTQGRTRLTIRLNLAVNIYTCSA